MGSESCQIGMEGLPAVGRLTSLCFFVLPSLLLGYDMLEDIAVFIVIPVDLYGIARDVSM